MSPCAVCACQNLVPNSWRVVAVSSCAAKMCDAPPHVWSDLQSQTAGLRQQLLALSLLKAWLDVCRVLWPRRRGALSWQGIFLKLNAAAFFSFFCGVTVGPQIAAHGC